MHLQQSNNDNAAPPLIPATSNHRGASILDTTNALPAAYASVKRRDSQEEVEIQHRRHRPHLCASVKEGNSAVDRLQAATARPRICIPRIRTATSMRKRAEI